VGLDWELPDYPQFSKDAAEFDAEIAKLGQQLQRGHD